MLFSESFYDAPNQEPRIKFPLDTVSVFNQKIGLSFYDELFGEVNALMDVHASVSLGATQRGIHMSRIEQAFQDLPQQQSLTAVALLISERICEAQMQSEASIRLSGDVLLARPTQVTKLQDHSLVHVTAQATAGDTQTVEQGLQTTVITACPCMQAYSLDALVQEFGLSVDSPHSLTQLVPIATHSQKGKVIASISGSVSAMENISLKHIYNAFQKGTHPTYELLKRPDEFDLVRRSHARPQFVEDVVRDVLAEVYWILQEQDSSLNLVVQAESYESIHGHDIGADVACTLGELASMMRCEFASEQLNPEIKADVSAIISEAELPSAVLRKSLHG